MKKKYWNPFDYLGTKQILSKQAGWVGEVGQILTFVYKVGRWVKANDNVSIKNVCLEKQVIFQSVYF